MGYETSYYVSVSSSVDDLTELCEFPAEPPDLLNLLNENLERVDERDARGWCKWYDCDEELTEVSKLYPNLLIIVEGVGEEYGDIWRLYVHNGKCVRHYAEIVFPPYDKAEFK